MSIITTARQQVAVWWSREGQGADDFGKITTCAPREVECRWDDKTDEFIDEKGSPQRSKAVLMVDDAVDFKIGDVLRRGTLDQVEFKDDAKANKNAWEVRGITLTPNIKNTETLKMLFL